MKSRGVGFLVLLIGMVFSSLAWAEVKVEYKISRTHGLIKFAYAISGRLHESENILETFESSSFKKDPKVLAALQSIAEVHKSLEDGFNFRDAGPDRNPGMNVEGAINLQSLFARDIKDLSERILGWMPTEDHLKFFQALKVLDPVYEKLIWRSSEPTLRKEKSELERISKKAKIDSIFKRVQTFYGVTWPAELPFTIGLYPIPKLEKKNNSSSSRSLGSVEEHGVLIGYKDPDHGGFGVIIHELCHSVYDSQSNEMAKQWEVYFEHSQSPYRKIAKNWLNETLATAIGNGWADEKANGKLEKARWYEDETIDPFAKEIYPLVAEYLNQNKALDQELADKILAAFAKRFPDAISEYSNFLNRLILFSDKITGTPADVSKLLQKNFRLSYFQQSAPLDHPISIEVANGDKRSSFLVVLSAKGMEQLKEAGLQINAFKDKMEMIRKMKSRTILTYQESNLRLIIFVRAENLEELEQAYKWMQKEKIDFKNPLRNY